MSFVIVSQFTNLAPTYMRCMGCVRNAEVKRYIYKDKSSEIICYVKDVSYVYIYFTIRLRESDEKLVGSV